MGELFKAIGYRDPQARRAARDLTRDGWTACCRRAPLSSALPGIRHAFFTREGGVSDGIYASLNGGIGSNDAPAKVAENRARMAAALGVAPERLLTAYQIHSPDVVVVERAWTRDERPRADAIVTRVPGLAIGVTPPTAGRCCSRMRRRGVIGAAHAGWRGALHRRARGDHRRDGAARRRPRPHRRRARADDPPAELRGRAGIRRPLRRRRCRAMRDSSRLGAAGPCAVRPARLYRRPARARRHRAASRTSATAPMPIRARFYSYRRTTHRGEPDYGRHINAIALLN